MLKELIILIGPPGAGKGTQAEILSNKFGLEHVETSRIIEEKLKDIEPNDIELGAEKKEFLVGELVNPVKVAKWFLEKVEELSSRGIGLVLSGSPRTLYEVKLDMKEFDRLYGRENIKIFYIKLSEQESINRNSVRRICQAKRHPIPSGSYDPKYKDITTCPWDDSPIVTRSIDVPEIIKERCRVFKVETEPVLDYLRGNGYEVIEIEGEQGIEKVSEMIEKKLNKPSD